MYNFAKRWGGGGDGGGGLSPLPIPPMIKIVNL